MANLDLKKLQVEYKRVNAAKEEQELRVLELLEQIQKLQDAIAIQETKEVELSAKIKELQQIKDTK